LWFVFERWDGKGMPAGVAGERIPIAARILHAAGAVILGKTSLCELAAHGHFTSSAAHGVSATRGASTAHYWRLRDGKVTRFRGSEDSALTAQAFAR
jgi:hypothetical protein